MAKKTLTNPKATNRGVNATHYKYVDVSYLLDDDGNPVSIKFVVELSTETGEKELDVVPIVLPLSTGDKTAFANKWENDVKAALDL